MLGHLGDLGLLWDLNSETFMLVMLSINSYSESVSRDDLCPFPAMMG